MLSKLLCLTAGLILTTLFAGCASFEYSEPGVYGYYEPNAYYDRYPRYYHGPVYPRHYVHAYAAPRPIAHPPAEPPHEEHAAESHDGGHR